MRRAALVLVLLSAAAPLAGAQEQVADMAPGYRPRPEQRRTMSAGARYDRGGVHRTLFGAHYRALWATPVPVPVLDLGRFAGGLEPKERGGGQQTRSLELDGADGRSYVFRSVDKDPTPAVPPMFRGTVVHRLVQDAISAAHPGGPLVAASLLRSAGVPHAEPRLVVMPDDAALAEFRRDFAGLLGYIEEKPGDGFAGGARVLDSQELGELLDADPAQQVDARAFLRARLMDQLMGDWDRHRDQWRWAGVPHGADTLWRPIPRDRDQAFVRYDGLLPGLVRLAHPKLVVFGPKYPPVLGLTWNGRDLDRRFLSGLDSADFESVAASLAARITDAAIDSALARLPAPYRRQWLEPTRAALRLRRDGLVTQARRYYRLLAEDVDVRATDRAELVEAERHDDGGLTLRVCPREGGAPCFRRRFLPGETREVRLYLRGDGDRVSVSGARRGGVLLRVIGGDGDAVAGAAGRDVRTYRAEPARAIEGDDPNETGIAPRDWGGSFGLGPRAGYDPDLGLLLGAQATRTDYAFRREPYGSRLRLAAEYAPRTGGVRVGLDADIRRADPRQRIIARVTASQLDVVRFTGLGNETRSSGGSDFVDVQQWRFTLAPSWEFRPMPTVRLSAGPVARYTSTRLDGDHLVGVARPRGAGGFGRVGAAAELGAEGADSTRVRRARLDLGGSAFPSGWSARQGFGELHAVAVARLPLGSASAPVVAARLGGKRVWGAFPYDEAAFLGGWGTLRGYRYQRFAGNASLYGGAEVRLPLARVFTHTVPVGIGLIALAEAGRVWAEGEDSRRVHTGLGGGASFAFFDPRYTITLTVAGSREGTLWYLGTGLVY